MPHFCQLEFQGGSYIFGISVDTPLDAGHGKGIWKQFYTCTNFYLNIPHAICTQFAVLTKLEQLQSKLTFHSKKISNRRMIAPAHAESTTIHSGTISGFSGASVGTTSVITSSVRRLT